MQYLALMHAEPRVKTLDKDWNNFFQLAENSGIFRGGSEINNSKIIGTAKGDPIGNKVVGYMRFDCDDKDKLLELLKQHPLVLSGGKVELFEMPLS
jgi:hypothetical protein